MSGYINRVIKDSFLKKLKPNKVLLLLGARRVGKTSFINQLLKEEIKEDYIMLNGEDTETQIELSYNSAEKYKSLLGGKKLLVIDEAQKINSIGNCLKLMVDSIDGIKIIASGSSVFDLMNKLGEPLTGRKSTFILYPFAQMEYSQNENIIQTRSLLSERIIFGNYPELLHLKDQNEKADYLKELVNSYLLKDILQLDGIRNSSKILNLLRLLAFQIGREVSLDELGNNLGISKNTVEKYLDLLSKVFVIYKLSGFSRNLRKEITKMSRWYFFDNGIRNTLIANFNSIDLRNDIGELWENYLCSERIKYQQYNRMIVNNYFWRTYQQQEIDWIEEHSGKLFATEMKWNENKSVKIPSAWRNAYPDSEYQLITPANYLDWIM